MFSKRYASAPAFAAVLLANLLAYGQLPVRSGLHGSPLPQMRVARVEAPDEGKNPLHFRVNEPVERLEMIVRSSRILTLDYRVPRMLANNAEIIKVTPLSPNQIQVSALKPGVTQLTLWDEKDNVMSLDVVVYGDARELDNILKVTFPEASIKVIPLASSVMLSGFVPEVDLVARIVRTAEDYYPKVVNNLTVGGTQKILLHVKVMEVSRTKLRKLGFDWAEFNSGGFHIVQSAAGLISAYSPGTATATGSGGSTVNFGIVNANNQFFGFLEALRQYNMVKILAEPTLVTVSGRPATFMSGGEFPVLVPQSLGTVTIQYRQYGTRVDFVPLVLGKGAVRLEVRPQVTEIDRSTAVSIGTTNVPGLRSRWVDTAVEMKVGQTFALAGLLQQRVEAENKGLPLLADLPWLGAAFRRVQETVNEVELLITVTPEFAEAVDPQEMPPCGPGQLTTSPSDCELYGRGYLEVPKCGDNCGPGGVGPGPGNNFGIASPPGSQVFPGNNYSAKYPVPARQPNVPPTQNSAFRQNPNAVPYDAGSNQATPPPVQVAPVSMRDRMSGSSAAPVYDSRPKNVIPRAATVNPAAAGDGNLLGPLGYDDLK